MPALLDNPGLSDDARNFAIVLPIPQPIEGLDTPIVLASPFEFDILRIWRRTQDGNCEASFYIDGELVELDDAESAGEISADEGQALATLPDSTDPLNYRVPEFGRFSFIVDNVSTTVVGLEMQIDCRKAQVQDTGT